MLQDPDGDGEIDFDEFVVMLTTQLSGELSCLVAADVSGLIDTGCLLLTITYLSTFVGIDERLLLGKAAQERRSPRLENRSTNFRDFSGALMWTISHHLTLQLDRRSLVRCSVLSQQQYTQPTTVHPANNSTPSQQQYTHQQLTPAGCTVRCLIPDVHRGVVSVHIDSQ